MGSGKQGLQYVSTYAKWDPAVAFRHWAVAYCTVYRVGHTPSAVL